MIVQLSYQLTKIIYNLRREVLLGLTYPKWYSCINFLGYPYNRKSASGNIWTLTTNLEKKKTRKVKKERNNKKDKKGKRIIKSLYCRTFNGHPAECESSVVYKYI